MTALDFRLAELRPIVEGEEDCPVVQTIHMRRDAALALSEKLLQWAHATPQGGWVEANIIGYRLVPAALEGLLIRGYG